MLKFKCFIEGVAEKMPIIPTKEHSFEWFQKAREFYSQNKHLDFQTTRCPGIASIFTKGWIQKSYQDFVIKTNGDEESFAWESEIDQHIEVKGIFFGDYVSFHSADQLADFKKFPPGTLKTMIKIHSPWFVEIPKGYSLLVMPVPYSDESRFTAATGILKGNQFLNVQLYWHCLNSTEVVKAGTPLNQMLLIKDDVIAYDIETIEDASDYLREKWNLDAYRLRETL